MLSGLTGRLQIGRRVLTNEYGEKRAVDGISFAVRPDVVTGFLGPNGSGQSTTMRLSGGITVCDPL
jgi:ABC-2 type transport system ATP-binding protein